MFRYFASLSRRAASFSCRSVMSSATKTTFSCGADGSIGDEAEQDVDDRSVLSPPLRLDGADAVGEDPGVLLLPDAAYSSSPG